MEFPLGLQGTFGLEEKNMGDWGKLCNRLVYKEPWHCHYHFAVITS